MDGCVLLTSTPSCVVSPRGDPSGCALGIARRGETTHSGVDVNNTHPSMINPLNNTETKMSSFWWNFHHWLHWKLSFWQLSVQPVMKISSKWRHFRFSEAQWCTSPLKQNPVHLFQRNKHGVAWLSLFCAIPFSGTSPLSICPLRLLALRSVVRIRRGGIQSMYSPTVVALYSFCLVCTLSLYQIVKYIYM